MSEPNITTFLSTITEGENCNSRDSTINEGEEVAQIGIESLPDIPQLFVLASNLSSRSHKSSSVWKYFGHFDLNLHDDMKYHRVYVIYRDSGCDKAISVGKGTSPSALIAHLKTHKEQYAEYDESIEKKRKDFISSTGRSQSSITKYISSQALLKENFKHKFARWIVEDSLPLVTCRSLNVKCMIASVSKQIDVPSYKTVMSHLYAVKMGAVSKMKIFLKGEVFFTYHGSLLWIVKIPWYNLT
jgi:hypothetical protein